VAYRPFEADLSGRVALVTGANRGMGKETARELARMGAAVILACRSKERGEQAATEITETTGRSEVTAMEVDLSSLASVRAFAPAFHERLPKLDVLVPRSTARTRSIWLTASPDLEGVTGKFWNKRREVRCRFRDPKQVEQLWRLVEQQTGQSESFPVWPVPQ
jgi:short-subunit dehydrogenase involved in D-alanine esterification of teichoic acids